MYGARQEWESEGCPAQQGVGHHPPLQGASICSWRCWGARNRFELASGAWSGLHSGQCADGGLGEPGRQGSSQESLRETAVVWLDQEGWGSERERACNSSGLPGEPELQGSRHRRGMGEGKKERQVQAAVLRFLASLTATPEFREGEGPGHCLCGHHIGPFPGVILFNPHEWL